MGRFEWKQQVPAATQMASCQQWPWEENQPWLLEAVVNNDTTAVVVASAAAVAVTSLVGAAVTAAEVSMAL